MANAKKKCILKMESRVTYLYGTLEHLQTVQRQLHPVPDQTRAQKEEEEEEKPRPFKSFVKQILSSKNKISPKN